MAQRKTTRKTTYYYFSSPLSPTATVALIIIPRMEGKLTVFVTTTCLLAATIAIGELNSAPAPLALPIPYYKYFYYSANGASLPGFEECVLNNHHYGIGETFHPIIDVNGTKFEAVCFNCTCLPVRERVAVLQLTANFVRDTRAHARDSHECMHDAPKIYGVGDERRPSCSSVFIHFSCSYFKYFKTAK